MTKKKTIFSFIILLFGFCAFCQEPGVVYSFIKDKSSIKEGGTELFAYNGDQYLITVASLSVGNKTEQQCKVVGSGKAKRDMLAYINGSEITSCTELITKENVVELSTGKTSLIEQQYLEHIKETVLGTINEITPLGGWFSEDQSVYYFAITKIFQ